LYAHIDKTISKNGARYEAIRIFEYWFHNMYKATIKNDTTRNIPPGRVSNVAAMKNDPDAKLKALPFFENE
jgi:hypothetical protein